MSLCLRHASSSAQKCDRNWHYWANIESRRKSINNNYCLVAGHEIWKEFATITDIPFPSSGTCCSLLIHKLTVLLSAMPVMNARLYKANGQSINYFQTYFLPSWQSHHHLMVRIWVRCRRPFDCLQLTLTGNPCPSIYTPITKGISSELTMLLLWPAFSHPQS